MRDEQQRTLKMELLSQWKLEAEFRNFRASRKKRNIVSQRYGGGVRGRLEVLRKFIKFGIQNSP